MGDARTAHSGKRLYGDREAHRVLRPGSGLERRMTAIGAIVGRRLAIGILERAREGVGRAVAGALGDCPREACPSLPVGPPLEAAAAAEPWR